MQQNERISLPIDAYLEQIHQICQRHSTVIVKASPGSGKTTRLPWLLARHSPKKVLVLEPRRLAARLAAQRIALEEGFTLGHEVGYHFRFEKNYRSNTRLIFFTEGTFLRHLLHDPNLMDVDTVILDEFHERHIETDLSLALLRGIQLIRPQLKIVLMSATLDTKLVEAFTDAGLIEIEAHSYEVEINYLPNQPSILNLPLETKIKRSIENLDKNSGDILVFVPGMREMLKVRDHLGEGFGPVMLLHADLSKEEQQDALEEKKFRKIILATNIAESSVTIPGIKVVIDSGIQREAKYSPWTGLKTLEDRPITQSSSIQRAGRAGRISNGICFRLYSEQDFKGRNPFTEPEILKADLTDTYLLTRRLSSKLLWYTPPLAERWDKARELAYRLGALNDNQDLTSIGQEMLQFPLSARLSRTLLAGKDLSLNEKRKLLSFICEVIEKDNYGLLKKRLSFFLKDEGSSSATWQKALLAGFVDQVAKFRTKQHDFIHYSGKTLKAHHSLKELHQGYYLVLDVTSRIEAITVIPIEEEWLYDLNPFPFSEEVVIEVSEEFNFKRITRIGSIPLEEVPVKLEWHSLRPEQNKKILKTAESIFQKNWKVWQESDTFLRFHFWARHNQKDLDQLQEIITLKNYLEEWQTLSWQHLNAFFLNKMENFLKVTSLDDDLPLKINLGGKRDLPVQYPYGMDPFVEAPIQDFYGVKNTPSIFNGRVPLTLKLLGPHKRPIQVTRDIVGFWKKTYQEMKREWQRDYPRHYWPEDPIEAKPVLLKRQLPG